MRAYKSGTPVTKLINFNFLCHEVNYILLISFINSENHLKIKKLLHISKIRLLLID